MTLIPFVADAKSPLTATELATGDLEIQGWGARFDTIDLEDEWWDGPAAFRDAVPDFIKRGGTLCYGHRRDAAVGRVSSAEITPKGVWLKAVVDYQPENSPLRWIWEGVRKGRIAGLSAAGKFERFRGAKGVMLRVKRLVEWSIAPIVMGDGCDFSVIARTALDAPEGKAVTASGLLIPARDETAADLHAIKATLNGEKMFWNRKAEPKPRPTTYADAPGSARPGLAQAQERNRQGEAQRQARLKDGLNNSEDAPLHDFWGVEPAGQRRRDNERSERTFELTGDQFAALHGQAGKPIDVRDIKGKSALDVFAPSKIESMIDKLKILEAAK